MKESLELLVYVFAGLVATWVYYGLVPAAKPSPFNRLVDALVHTALIRLMMLGVALAVPPLAPVLENAASPSLADSFFGSSLIIGVSALYGMSLAILTNKNIPHRWLIAWGWTDQAAIRSNLSHAFGTRPNSFVVLNLQDRRRILGWPVSWPDRTDDNYFLLSDYRWLSEQGDEIEAGEKKSTDAAILIAGRDVKMIEFIPNTVNLNSTNKEHPQ